MANNLNLLQRIQAAQQQGIPLELIKRRVTQQYGYWPEEMEEQGQGFLRRLGSELIEPAKKQAQLLGEGALQALQYIRSPAYRKSVAGGVLSPEEREEVQRVAKPKFMPEWELKRTAERPWETAAKRSAGMLAYGVPMGRTAAAAIGLGTLAGGLREYSEYGATPKSVGTAALTGGVTGGAVYGAGRAVQRIKEPAQRLFRKGKEAVGRKATETYLKATPASFRKALTEHGLDIRKIAQKYVPAGSSYDDLLGTATERGRGGVLNETLGGAEQQIQEVVKTSGSVRISGDDFINALKKESTALSRRLGDESKRKALKNITKEAEKVYKNGMTVRKALAIARDANKKFGRSIVSTEKGAVASSAQKLHANTIKSILKGMFPELEDALRVQEEVLTLQPILNQARAAGSVGGIDLSIGGLINAPFKIPQVATTLGQVGTGVAEEAVPQAAQQVAPFSAQQLLRQIAPAAKRLSPLAASTIGGGAARWGGGQVAPIGEEPTGAEPETAGQLSPQGQWRWNPAANKWEPNVQLTPAQVSQVYLTQGKEAGDIARAALEVITKPEEKKLSSADRKLQASAKTAIRNLATMRSEIVRNPNIVVQAMIPGQPGARVYKAAYNNVIDLLEKMRTGMLAKGIEVERYEQILPRWGDSQDTLNWKFNEIEQIFRDFDLL